MRKIGIFTTMHKNDKGNGDLRDISYVAEYGDSRLDDNDASFVYLNLLMQWDLSRHHQELVMVDWQR